MKRKHISWKTKYASALLALGDIPYLDAKLMSKDQIISLFRVDHNIYYESEHPDVHKFWNLTPRLIKADREKTRNDLKIINKGRRIRAKNAAARTPKLRTGPDEARSLPMASSQRHPRPARSLDKAFEDWAQMKRRNAQRIQSRGFDKTLRKKMDGTVVKR